MRASVIARGALARFGVKPYPLGLTFEVTWLCNLACSYCDRHTPMANELTREQIFAALEEFYALGMRDVSLDGGEPLAHKCIREIVDWLGARAAQQAGVPVEFTCTLGRHNADVVTDLLAITEPMHMAVVFQPALNSLFNGSDRDGGAWVLGVEEMRRALA